MTGNRYLLFALSDWLTGAALREEKLELVLAELAERLRAHGVPVDRCRLTWPTLHPLFEAETMLWTSTDGVSTQRFDRQVHDHEGWLRSTIKWMLDNEQSSLRARLTQADLEPTFPLYDEMRDEGYTDMLALRTQIFSTDSPFRQDGGDFGIYIAWSSKAPGGFDTHAIELFNQLQPYVALLSKLIVFPRLIFSVTNTYLGPTIAREVLGGRITLGSGSQIEALVWYSDLRDSTGLAESMGSEPYLALLNDYFDCTGRAVVEAGGEILAFVGDAVMAIFPISADDPTAADRATEQAIMAAQAALAARLVVNERRVALGEPAIRFGIAMCIGEVRLGNIGISQRLSFSVIGPSANEVERIEKMTKELDVQVLVTEEITRQSPALWRPMGAYPLRGLRNEVELFALAAAV
ncbi:adenylate/guanylate cyclase domain-containing protein [Aureimonas fodinaquatilis]|uniref:Adenylate/guanylate cyclase domain-containing protein n=1 Tax=Aureimonas fodinaquatilis TaxID=2565783 RepID=A0A5B0DTA4_9HYPH|nr:adenylate/guanylate cyclase domain-containing protein [Aureimonas fodinaquatilis]KAA0969001.1 adenylate/guanylate cyclase domain-containing protein [Aureimonas fodinaquatilis]